MTNKNIELNTTQNFQELSWDKISEEWEEIFNSFEGNRFFQSQTIKNIWKNNFGKDSKYKIFVVSDTNNKMISPFKINEQKYTFIGSKDLFDYQDFIYSDHNDIDELLGVMRYVLSNSEYRKVRNLNDEKIMDPIFKWIFGFLGMMTLLSLYMLVIVL